MRTIATIEGQNVVELNDGTVTYTSKAAIDSDGAGLSHGDPYWQNDTSLHDVDGHPLNADLDKYIVVPPIIPKSVVGIVLGCQAFVTNTINGLDTAAVVGDIGPRKKLGEISIACAKALGINRSPIVGGGDAHVIHYSIKPGVPALVDGKAYDLQRYK